MTASVPGESSRGVAPRSGKGAFPRKARLLRHADFERVYKQGRRHFSASMTVFYWPRPEAATPDAAANKEASQARDLRVAKTARLRAARPGASSGKVRPSRDDKFTGLRIGFTVSRALGGAVQRNRMKRRLREAVRMTRPVAGADADVVINPKKLLLTVDFAAIVNEVGRAFVVIEQKLGKTDSGSRKPGA